MIPVMPRIARILNILDPIKFPIEISVSFLNAATTEVVNSGTLVPKATTVILTNFSLISKSLAILTTELINHSAPK